MQYIAMEIDPTNQRIHALNLRAPDKMGSEIIFLNSQQKHYDPSLEKSVRDLIPK